jgi:hypothetical protein
MKREAAQDPADRRVFFVLRQFRDFTLQILAAEEDTE